MKILVINGPNINMLGVREKDIYGSKSYDDLVDFVKNAAIEKGIETEFYQSNHEGNLVDRIQKAYFENFDGIIINPAAYTHTSIAILDALKAVCIKTVEVHLSDISLREDFRRRSFISQVCEKTIVGKGFEGYKEALNYFCR